jgi:hypothetical protein
VGIIIMPPRYHFEVAVLGSDWDFTQSLSISLNTHGFDAYPLGLEEADPGFLKSLALASRQDLIFLMHCEGLDDKIMRCLLAIEQWIPAKRVLFITGDCAQSMFPRIFHNPSITFLEKPVTYEQIAARLIELHVQPDIQAARA